MDIIGNSKGEGGFISKGCLAKSPFQTSLGEGVEVQIKESSVGGAGLWIFSGSTYFKSHGK